jgi:YHS domain-containing protein
MGNFLIITFIFFSFLLLGQSCTKKGPGEGNEPHHNEDDGGEHNHDDHSNDDGGDSHHDHSQHKDDGPSHNHAPDAPHNHQAPHSHPSPNTPMQPETPHNHSQHNHEHQPIQNPNNENLPKWSKETSKQRKCPVNGELLGSMGEPIPVKVNSEIIYICCTGCIKQFKEKPDYYLNKVKDEVKSGPSPNTLIPPLTPSHNHAEEKPKQEATNNKQKENIDLSKIKQKTCPVNGEPLGSMGTPITINFKGEIFYVCCKGCVKEAQSDPKTYLEKVKREVKELEIKEKAAVIQKQKEKSAESHQH